MKLYIRHSGQEVGPYSLEEVRSLLSYGSLLVTDLARHDGATDWQPISAMTSLLGSAPPPLPSQLPPPLPKSVPPALTLPRSPGLAAALWICGCVGGLILVSAIFAGIAVPVTISKIKRGALLEAHGNARSMGLALYSFEEEYGKYPCEATIAEVKANNPDTKLTLGSSSANDYLRQLIAAGTIDTGRPFYARIEGCRKPRPLPNDAPDLKKGECGFSYIIGPTPISEPPQPLLVTPLIPGTDRFDRKPFGGKAVILWTDCNVTDLPINHDGQVIHLGSNLLAPANPVWHGQPPKIVYPE